MVSFSFKPRIVGLTSALKIPEQTKQLSIKLTETLCIPRQCCSFLVLVKASFHIAVE